MSRPCDAPPALRAAAPGHSAVTRRLEEPARTSRTRAWPLGRASNLTPRHSLRRRHPATRARRPPPRPFLTWAVTSRRPQERLCDRPDNTWSSAPPAARSRRGAACRRPPRAIRHEPPPLQPHAVRRRRSPERRSGLLLLLSMPGRFLDWGQRSRRSLDSVESNLSSRPSLDQLVL